MLRHQKKKRGRRTESGRSLLSQIQDTESEELLIVYQGHDFGLYQFMFQGFHSHHHHHHPRKDRRYDRFGTRRISVSSIQTHESVDDETTKSNTFEGKLYKKTRNLKFFLHKDTTTYTATCCATTPPIVRFERKVLCILLVSYRVDREPSLESNNYYGFKSYLRV